MRLLHNQIQAYPWGSSTAISELTGQANLEGGPQAELWMGAHPTAPSAVDTTDGHDGQGHEGHPRRLPLTELIAADPDTQLGPATLKAFGPRLPFLLKVLAAQKALSIQLHPTRSQAEAGFADEESRGVPLGAPERVYIDDWPKPEILCALTSFEALAGLRPAGEAARVLAGLAVPVLAGVVGDLEAGSRPESPPNRGPAAVAEVLARLLSWPTPGRAELVEQVVAAATEASTRSSEFAGAYDAVRRMAADHPGDIGLVCSLLLNHLILEPGQALFMGAGGVHAYIHGTGIELLANSDNVIRAGLTPKHIDVPELLRVLDATVPVPVLTGRQESQGVEVFDTPVPEFRLRRLTVDGGEPLAVPGDGEPRILLCVEGEAQVRHADDVLTLAKGASCFLSAADSAVSVSGRANLFLASPGL